MLKVLSAQVCLKHKIIFLLTFLTMSPMKTRQVVSSANQTAATHCWNPTFYLQPHLCLKIQNYILTVHLTSPTRHYKGVVQLMNPNHIGCTWTPQPLGRKKRKQGFSFLLSFLHFPSRNDIIYLLLQASNLSLETACGFSYQNPWLVTASWSLLFWLVFAYMWWACYYLLLQPTAKYIRFQRFVSLSTV